MAGTRSGAPGVRVAGHVVEERNIVIVHAPIPILQTVVNAAVDWDVLQNGGNVTDLDAQVKLS